MFALALVPAALWLPLAPVIADQTGDGPTAEAIRAAVGRALPMLEAGTSGYLRHRDCFSCHHQAIPVFALDRVRGRGFAVDADNIASQAELTIGDLESALDAYKAGRGQGGGATRAGSALWMLDVAGHPADETTAAVVGYLLGRDEKAGHWTTSSDRPPTEASAFTTTFVTLRALQAYTSEAERPRLERRVEAARRWLEAAEARDNEDRVFRLWGLRIAGARPEALDAAASELRERQRPDGGWSQLDGGFSDPYATATALVALHASGLSRPEDPAYRRGLACLIRNQKPDGTWFVASRSRPFQPYFESGFPYGKDQFLSMSASAWAAAALAAALPEVPMQAETRK